MRAFVFFTFLLFQLGFVFAQVSTNETSQQKDLGDIFSSVPNDANATLQIGKLYVPLLPIIGYAPANGFVLGVGLAPAMLLDSIEHTHLSTLQANLQFTSLNQKNFHLRHNIYTSRDRFIFQGDWRLLFFTQPTYGLGIYDFPPVFSFMGLSSDEENGSQPMRFNYLRVYETLLRKVNNRFYLGAGIALDYHWNIKDELLQLDSSMPFITSHYTYSQIESYSAERYSANGILLRAVFDSRDNTVNAYSGIYIDLAYRLNTLWLGSDQKSRLLNLEARKYFSLVPNKQQLAFWFIGNFLLQGNLPYLALPSIGWDTYNRSGRGFIQGRFRGRNMAYAEAEWRFSLSKSGLLGGVVFVNTTTTDNRYANQYLADRFAFGYGAGLRIKMTKETRTNICIDLGAGSDGSSGIWFGLSEAF
jgi:hypothetical protein